MRTLFLDDDPARASAFAEGRPGVVWVQTVEECLARLEEPWDEVHLDHDLGGETFVDPDREDCGMAVVRWLCEGPRPHLQSARFLIHTHNANAACIMALHLQVVGYRVEVRPFGVRLPPLHPRPAEVRRRGIPLARRIVDWLRGRAGPRETL